LTFRENPEMKGIKYIQRVSLLITIMVFSCTLHAQNSVLNEQLSTYYFEHDETPQLKSFNRLDQLVNQLERKRRKQENDVQFLKSLFYRTHHKILRKYSKLASMNEMIEKGSYGCLTGTILYALLLDHFQFNYEVIELPNHVFLKVKLNDQNVFFESTLANEGFITNQDHIALNEANVSTKNTNWLQVISEKTEGMNHNEPFKIIGLRELSALQHFNESVLLYKNKSYVESITHAIEAYYLYPTEKNEMLMQLVLNKILTDQHLQGKEKEALVEQYKTIRSSVQQQSFHAALTPASK